MNDGNNWVYRDAGSISGSFKATQFFKKDLISIIVLPCNYDRGYSVMILPIPMPLGAQPEIEKGNQFLVGFNISSNKEFSGYPMQTVLKIDNKEILPIKVSENGSSCDLNEVRLTYETVSREWSTKDYDFKLMSEKHYRWTLTYTLWFDVKTPSTNTDFSLQPVINFEDSSKAVIPQMYFSKGSSGGGGKLIKGVI